MANADMQAGDTAGHFEILELLGSGVLTTVYRARNTRLDRIVALKILLSGADEKTLRRFREEARRMVRIQTPYVVTVYTLEELNVGPAIEMEYLEGGSLADRLRLGPPISVAEGRRYLEHALLGLQAIHKEVIVHRDIKPANIMFDRKGDLRIGDFGIAAFEGNVTTVHAATLQYAAPELIATGKFDRRADLYSLGMTAYEMFLGAEGHRRVFREVVGGSDDLQPTNWLAWHADPARKAPPLKELIKIDEETSDLVAKLMEKNREQRFQSADAALVRLRTAKSEPEAATAPPTVKLNVDEAGKSRRTQLMVGASVVAVLAGLALYTLFPPAWRVQTQQLSVATPLLTQGAIVPQPGKVDLPSPVSRTLKGARPSACFVVGSGEHSLTEMDENGYSDVKDLLEKGNYKTETLNFIEKPEISSDCTVLIMAGPSRDYTQPEVDTLRKFVEGGGRAMFLLDPPLMFGNTETAENKTLTDALASWGVTLDKDLVLDTSGVGKALSLGPETPLVTTYAPHAIVRKMIISSGFPIARSMSVRNGDKTIVEKLFETSDNSFATMSLNSPTIHYPDPTDKKGPLILAAAGNYVGYTARNGRFVVVGSSRWIVNSFLRFNGNRELFMNMMDWLTPLMHQQHSVIEPP